MSLGVTGNTISMNWLSSLGQTGLVLHRLLLMVHACHVFSELSTVLVWLCIGQEDLSRAAKQGVLPLMTCTNQTCLEAVRR